MSSPASIGNASGSKPNNLALYILTKPNKLKKLLSIAVSSRTNFAESTPPTIATVPISLFGLRLTLFKRAA
jgi:hypothetical protein